ncbi:sigma-70 family RNA polymerase sigma factor [Corallococcus macrosporus]|uniref:DNA-directed RNA polymerase sigma-70 factor n=1 Tax=Corallococcus macrosporus DSM 14697 TaxID=1189310 RepID=A0A250JUD8_9BACT|nr:sigma-70 family RNA polymerase sigma factor [Corallococcus macrosporus]ATB47092.1 DNA-directed RNA polymerase sigma-70 factor [Corallococcus macrosporus DSM 14697]
MSPAPGTLTALLLAGAPEPLHAALRSTPAVESLLTDLVARGRAAWPTVAVSPEALLHHVGRHLREQGCPLDALRQLHAEDVHLACACARGEPHALALFEKHVLQKAAARLSRHSAAQVDEVLQVTRQRLLLGAHGGAPKIAEYSGRGSLGGWVRIVASRIGGELLARAGRHEQASTPPEALEHLLSRDDPERNVLQAHSRRALSESLQVALEALSERERALLRLHHLHGLTMDRIATLYAEPRSSVARHVAQARERLLKRTQRELAARLKLDGREVESLLGLVVSRLDLSLHRLMG